MAIPNHAAPSPEYKGSYLEVALDCEICLHQWMAVYPMVCMRLQCPNCEHFRDAPIVGAIWRIPATLKRKKRKARPAVEFDVTVLPIADREEALETGLYYALRRLRER